MSEPIPTRSGWILPVLLAVATSVALGLGYLYLARPNAGELGSVRVVVSDDAGRAASAIHVVVSEAPMVQKDSVSPSTAFTGVVHYPVPYLTEPNLKLTAGKRRYSATAETEFGFTWVAESLPDDFREDAKKDSKLLDLLLGGSLAAAAAQGKLKPGLVFEDFTWEAKGLRAPPSALPPKTFEQKGSFLTLPGQESVVFFPIPYSTPPHVDLPTGGDQTLFITECTAKSFKWRSVAHTPFSSEQTINWTATGLLAPSVGK